VSVPVKKIPGVETVNVSLNKGLVSINLAPGNKVTMAQIRKAILDDAFTPKDAKVVAEGILVPKTGRHSSRSLERMRHFRWLLPRTAPGKSISGVK